MTRIHLSCGNVLLQQLSVYPFDLKEMSRIMSIGAIESEVYKTMTASEVYVSLAGAATPSLSPTAIEKKSGSYPVYQRDTCGTGFLSRSSCRHTESNLSKNIR